MIQFNTKEQLSSWILGMTDQGILELVELDGPDGDCMALLADLLREMAIDMVTDGEVLALQKKLRANLEHQYLIPEKFIDEGINEANREAERGSYDE